MSSSTPKNLTKAYLDIERKVINLMLRHCEVIGEMVTENINPDFFNERHQPLVQAIYYTHGVSDGKRLLTDAHYRSLLIEQGGRGDITVAMQVYHECLFGVHHSNTKDDFDFLRKQLIDSYVHRRGIECLEKFNQSVGKMGYVEATKQFIEELSTAVNLTEAKKSMFMIVDELQDKYIASLQDKKNDVEPKIECNIPEIDEAMNVGFKAGHTSLFVAATGNHKCLAYYEKCILEDGSWITASELRYRTYGGEKLSILSYDEQKGELYYQPVQAVVDNGDKECLRITTSLGFSVDVTENHPFLQLDGYNEASTLEVGDHVGMARHYKFGVRTKFDWTKEAYSRNNLAFWLGCMYSDGGTSQPLYTFTNQDNTIVKMMSNVCELLGGELKQKKIHGELVDGNYYITSLRQIGRDYRIDGCKAIEKSLHPDIFRWDQPRLSVFLRAMFACDGCFKCTKGIKKSGEVKINCSVIYSSSSNQLAKDVRDLLMKFGLIAKLARMFVKYKGEKRESWQVKICDSYQVKKFVEQIGFYGAKQEFSTKSVASLDVSPNRNKDLIPSAIWELIDRKFVLRGKSYNSYKEAKKNGDVKRLAKKGSGINRDSLAEIAKYLDNDEQLLKLAQQEVLWDKIISIEPVGKHKTYDIAMPIHHNFITNGFITHNTNMMLNVALNIYRNGHNVLFLPLEMDWEDFTTRIISNASGVTYQSLLNPKQMTTEDFKKVKEAKTWISQPNKFALLDVDEQISIPVLRRELERRANYFAPKVVVVDYLGLLKTQNNFGQRHDLALGELTKSLKFLGKKYGFHIITAAQLGRADIRRLREEGSEAHLDSTAVKGSQEVSSDVEFIFALTTPPDEDDRLKLHVIKARYGASGYTKDLRVEPHRCRIFSMEHGKQTPAQAGDAIGDDEWNLKLNEPVEQIVQKIEEIKFQGMDPNDLDDIVGM